MFWKKIEFTSLQAWRLSTHTHPGALITTAAHTIALGVAFVLLVTVSGVFIRGILFALSFFFYNVLGCQHICIFV